MAMKLLRRRNLGRGSCLGIRDHSTTGIGVHRSWRDNYNSITPHDTIIRWGCTANINTDKVINTARAIHQVNDKAGFRMLLNEHGLCPPTWDHGAMVEPENFPVIVRPAVHSRGRHLTYCEGYEDMVNAYKHYDGRYYISKYIPKVAEYRVYVVQGRAIAVAEKVVEDKSAIAWNNALGVSSFVNVSWDNWPLKAVRTSIEAFNLSELDFGGVDVMVDAEGRCYVLEINSAPTLSSEYRQSCFAKAFDWIAEHGKERIPLIEERGGYRKFIHPAICERAQLV